MKFYKYQGTGNDFVIIDDRENEFPINDTSLVERLCHRRFGVGADGLMLLRLKEGYDFEMVYYNSDGNQSSMCGNGGRCLVKFAYDLGVIGNECTFIAIDGPHDAKVENDLVHLKMINVNQVECGNEFYWMNTGSPHFVKNVSDIETFPVFEEGKAIRYNDRFKKEGTNVNFSEWKDDVLWVRTYERGVEDETYSCGTGVTAAAIAASYNGIKSPVQIKTLGGNLSVSFDKYEDTFVNVYLIGPAVKVFEGDIVL